MKAPSLAAFAVLLGGFAAPVPAQQVADSAFAPAVPHPAFAEGRGPVVLLDEAHFNFHTASGRYFTFARLLRRDGFVVRPLTAPFSAASLAGARVLVIANALAERNRQDWSLPTPSAFTPDEIAAVREWVLAGGALLLIADHMPFPGAAGDLAAAFGFALLNGYVGEGNPGPIVFRRSDGSLASHPVTEGRSTAERVDSVTSFTGEAFRAGSGSPLMVLRPGSVIHYPTVAGQITATTPSEPIGGLFQGAVTVAGRGRVAVFGEAAMFSAQLAGPTRAPMGMNAPAAAQNPQFLLNVMHWLVGLLPER
jgi:hypothetical protein